MKNEQEIELVFLNLSNETQRKALLDEAVNDERSHKDVALQKMGIKKREKETHLEAYMRYLHELNDFEYQKPSNDQIADAVFNHGKTLSMVFFLA